MPVEQLGPALRRGMWALFGEHGKVLRCGHELAGVSAPERSLLKVVSG